MRRIDLLEMIRAGENSQTEFKRDDIAPEVLAKELTALLNHEGGWLLLGVGDDREILGLNRSPREAEEWVMNVARHNIQPATSLGWYPVGIEGKIVGAVAIPSDSRGKPHKALRRSAWITFVRVGTTAREATREEEARLYQAAGLIRYDVTPVPDTSLVDLDGHWLENYFRVVLERDAPDHQNGTEWQRVLLNLDLLGHSAQAVCATVAGLLLFGKNPNRRLPQSGVTATAFSGRDKDYDTIEEELIRGPLASVITSQGRAVEKGVIDRTVDFVNRNAGTTAQLDGGRRIRRPVFPLDAVREAVVNAVVHRDYTIAHTDLEVSLYADRLEVISPGRLPNGVTVEKMKEGVRVARNEILKEVLRDWGYVEHRGMGVRNRIIRSMREHNGTEPDLVEDETRFIVRLWKNAPSVPDASVGSQ